LSSPKKLYRSEKTNREDPNPSRENAEFPFTYIVQGGDTLDKIAERYYGKKSEWKRIADNNDVSPRNLQIGQKLTIVAP
jgi:LysM repeat protein